MSVSTPATMVGASCQLRPISPPPMKPPKLPSPVPEPVAESAAASTFELSAPAAT